MKKVYYRLFAVLFNLYTLLPVRNDRITLLAPHPESEHDSLRELKSYIEKTGGYDIREISVPRGSVTGFIGFILNKSRILATSKYIFLNDNFMPMADMKFRKGTVVTQLWHGEGAFKKFGLDTDLPDDIRERLVGCSSKLSCIVTSSANVSGIYAKAFGTDISKIKALGSPRCDSLIENRGSPLTREKYEKLYPEIKDKKLILKNVEVLENMKEVQSGAIQTCNHFYPFDCFTMELMFRYSGQNKRQGLKQFHKKQ